MALISCKECGANVSDQATACPKCGCPIVKTDCSLKKIDESTWRKLGEKFKIDVIPDDRHRIHEHYIKCVKCSSMLMFEKCSNCGACHLVWDTIGNFPRLLTIPVCYNCGLEIRSFMCPECSCVNPYPTNGKVFFLKKKSKWF